MNDVQQYFPAEIFRDKDGACPIFTYTATQAASTNVTWVAAVTGKRHRIIEMLGVSDAAAQLSLNIYSNAVGTLVGRTTLPASTSNTMLKLDFNPGGWFETVTGELLGGSTGAGAQGLVTIRYITYTP
jgi:hypothetical protein